jgi:type VI secretion system secreted protein Hcp
MAIYLKYGDIDGDVTEPAYRTYIELMSVQFGQGRPTHSSDSPQASPNVSEIVVTKEADSASARLASESVAGQGVPAIIDFVRDDGSVSLRLEMSGTMISSYQRSGSGDNPTESLTLNFTRMEYKNNPGTPAP